MKKRKYDFLHGKITKTSDLERKSFVNNMAFNMQLYESSSSEVNELINWLLCMSDDCVYREEVKDRKDVKLKPKQKTDENTVIAEVWENDIILLSNVTILHQYLIGKEPDVLTDIVDKLFFALDKIVHPYDDYSRDLKNVRFYVELEYEPKEQ